MSIIQAIIIILAAIMIAVAYYTFIDGLYTPSVLSVLIGVVAFILGTMIIIQTIVEGANIQNLILTII